MRAEERIAPAVIAQIRHAVEEADGNEVFLVGTIGAEGLVESAAVGARGSDEAVPVLRPHVATGDVVIHNHPSGGVRPSGADLSIAARLGDEGIGFFIVDNEVRQLYAVAEPVARRQIVPLDVPTLAACLAPGGALERLVPWFEERPGQVGMLRLVAGALNGDGLLAVEAGTGVGKSLAYLLPALAWAAGNGERVVVSTNTINLQQQLVEKDIPLARRVLGLPDLKVALVKGRGNYLCLRRLAEAVDEATLFDGPDTELASLREWAAATATGDRSDLSFYPSDESWSRVCSEADSCLGLHCERREGCFVLRARREASAAKVLVANHHLLFADLALRLSGQGFDDPAVLPPFRRVIFDEAHHIEQAATSFFSHSFSRWQVVRTLNRLHRRRKGRVAGLVPAIARLTGRPLRHIAGLVAGVQAAMADLDAVCLDLAGEAGTLLLDESGRERFLASARAPLAAVSGSIRELVEKLSSALEERGDAESLIWDCRVQLNRLAGIADTCDRFRDAPEGGREVYWLESVRGRGDERAARLVITPLDVGPLMAEAIYEPMRTAVFTSATLTVAGTFSYWAGRIGLAGLASRDVETAVFPSPFDYSANVLLGVPVDAPPPDDQGHPRFLMRFLAEALRGSRGGGLVLFTSRALLREVHAAVAPVLAGQGIRALRQGDDDRARLLDRFREDRGSVLFATDSFWEGVDAPGETLRIVVMCRLPFRVPSEPVLRARMAAVEARGGDPFAELSLPDAVVRLRQGFGRLMRRRDDRGVVLVLDPRIVTRRYGAIFLESLPPAGRVIAGAREVIAAVEQFFRRSQEG